MAPRLLFLTAAGSKLITALNVAAFGWIGANWTKLSIGQLAKRHRHRRPHQAAGMIVNTAMIAVNIALRKSAIVS
jgi:hypothetical protein